MDAIVALERLTEADRERAGDKACRLARIAASGFEVAPALCVTTTAYRAFVDANHQDRDRRPAHGRRLPRHRNGRLTSAPSTECAINHHPLLF